MPEIKSLRIYLFAIVILVAAACDKSLLHLNYREKTFSERKLLENRVKQFMQFSKKRDLRAVYELLLPEYKERVDFSDFKESFSLPTVGVVSYYIEFIDIKEDTASVLLSEFIKPMGIPSFFLYNDVELIWKKHADKWLFDLDKTMMALRNPNASPSSDVCGKSIRIENNQPNVCGS